MMTFLIMAGGSGERFWPLSTKDNPKQLLHIFNKKSLIRLAYDRVLPLVNKKQIFISTNEIQVEALRKELPDVDEEHIIIEPMFKDTAAAISYGSLIVSKYFENPTICVLASDHLINDEEEFRKVLLIGSETAEKRNCIVTLGIKPTCPEIGYGYIKVGKFNLEKPTKCLSFKEKPNIDIATDYVESSEYLWNSGMFIFKYDVLSSELKSYAKEHYNIIKKINLYISKNEGLKTANDVIPCYEKFEKISIDFAIMEKTNNIYVVPCNIGWNDVGSYRAFDDLLSHDEYGNVVKDINIISVDSSNNIIIGEDSNQRVSLLGISNKIVVCTKKEILICDKGKAKELKKVVKYAEEN